MWWLVAKTRMLEAYDEASKELWRTHRRVQIDA
jgi:hypothetical protein